MATVTRASIPADEFALRQTIADLPDAMFECERIVESGDESVMPLVWARNVGVDTLEATLDEDPDVQEYSLLADFGDELLYRMVWVDHVRLVLEMVTTLQATVMNAYSSERNWELRILYPEREALSKTHEFCQSHGLSFEVLHVREMEGEPSGRFGLTEEQHEALTKACEAGYYSVPRETDLDRLADDLGISHQALSERLRRGSEVLVQEALLVGPLSSR